MCYHQCPPATTWINARRKTFHPCRDPKQRREVLPSWTVPPIIPPGSCWYSIVHVHLFSYLLQCVPSDFPLLICPALLSLSALGAINILFIASTLIRVLKADWPRTRLNCIPFTGLLHCVFCFSNHDAFYPSTLIGFSIFEIMMAALRKVPCWEKNIKLHFLASFANISNLN